MIKKFTLPLLFCSLMSTIPTQADFSDGLIVGGVAGLATGLIASSIAQKCSTPDVVYVEEPVVVYEEPVVVYEQRIEPRVVYEPAPIACKRSRKRNKEAELAWREDNVRRAEAKQQRKEQEADLRRREDAIREKSRKPQKEIVEKTIVETRTVAAKADTENIVALKQLELELLREENKKKELALKEKELALKQQELDRKRSKGSADKENIKEEIVTKTVTRKAAV